MTPPRPRKYAERSLPYAPSGQSGYRAKEGRDSIPENVLAFIHTWVASLRIAHMSGSKEVAGLDDESIVISVMKNDMRKNALHLVLTDLTSAEHSALREFFTKAFDITEPIVQARDKAASDAWEIDGDDSNYRQYRTAPQVVVRDRTVRKYTESCLERSAYVPRAERAASDPPEDDRADGDGVAEDTASQEGASDDPEVSGELA